MSVLVVNRNESRYEPIVFSIKLHNMLIEFSQRNYGIKNWSTFVRKKYACGKTDLTESEVFSKYNYLMTDSKKNIDMIASLLTNNLIAARSIYPVCHCYKNFHFMVSFRTLFRDRL